MFQVGRFLPKLSFTNILAPIAPILCDLYPKSVYDFNAWKFKFNNNNATVLREYEYHYNDYYFREIIKLDSIIKTNYNNNDYIINEKISIDIDTFKELKIKTNYLLNINSDNKIYFEYDIKFNKKDPILIDLNNYFNNEIKNLYKHLS